MEQGLFDRNKIADMFNFKLSGNSFTPRAAKLYEKTNVLNVSGPERLISFAAGTLLYSIGLGTRKLKVNKLFTYSGLYLLYRGISGNCLLRATLDKNSIQQHTHAVNIRSSFTVNAPKEDVYNAWRDLEDLPRHFRHIKKIKVVDEIHSRWTLKTTSAMPKVEWEAEIIEQKNNHELSWRSTPGSMIENAGKIVFADTLKGTEIIVLISYRPPAGYIGSALAHILNPGFKRMVEEDLLQDLKNILN